MVEMVTGKSL